MTPIRWSLVATAAAALLFWSEGRGASDASLRLMGLAGGAGLVLVGVLLGLLGLRGRRGVSSDVPESASTHTSRFFLDRRRAPRHDVRIPVRFSVNGQSYAATLVNVSAGGALLRLRLDPGETLTAGVGQPVRIADYPSGTLARIGRSGVYVDFAVRFEPAPLRPQTDPPLVESSTGSSLLDA